MPEMAFHCPYSLNYTESRDAQDRNLGLVEPGDIRDLDEAPDQWWREVTDEDRAAAEQAQAADETAPAAGEDGEPGGDIPDAGDEAPEPSAPTPAPPQW